MTGDKAIRRLTAAAVLLVATIAAVVSFVHIEHLAVTHGQTALASLLLPLSIDGTVAAASLVMLRAARAGLTTPWLARFMLALSVTATLAANIGYGLPYGVPGALLSGWPAVAFVGSVEMVLGMIRRARQVPAPALHPLAVGNGHAAPEGAAEAARLYAADLASGAVPSIRRIRREMHVGQPRAEQVQRYLAQIAPQGVPHITRGITASGAPVNVQVTGPQTGDG